MWECRTLALCVTFYRVGLSWFHMAHAWCKRLLGPLLGEKRERWTDIRASHVTHEIGALI
jgi:hypothetical protein